MVGHEESDGVTKVDKRQRIIVTVLGCLAWGFMGAELSIIGPCLMDFAMYTHTSLEKMAALYSWRSAGFVCGSILVGPLFIRLNQHLGMFISLTVTGVTLIVAPWCRNPLVMGLFVGAHGVFAALAQLGITAEFVFIWGTKSAPFVQASLFFLSGFGMLAPLLVRPFLSTKSSEVLSVLNDTMATSNAIMTSLGPQNESQVWTDALQQNLTEQNRELLEIQRNETLSRTVHSSYKIPYAFLICSLPLVLIASVRLAYFIRDESTCIVRKKKDGQVRETYASGMSLAKTVLVVSIFGMIGFLFGGMEIIWCGYSAGYAVKYRGWTTHKAAFIPFAYWLCVTISRVFAVILARTIRAAYIFMSCTVGLLITAVVLVILTDENPIVISASSGLIGFFAAPMVASGINWMCDSLGPSGIYISIFYGILGIGATSMSIGIAKLCELVGVWMFTWMVLIISIVMFVLVVLECLLTRKPPKVILSTLEMEKHKEEATDLTERIGA